MPEYSLYINPMLNLKNNVGRKLIVCGEGKVNLQKCFGQYFDGYLLCFTYTLQKCKEEGNIPSFAFKKYFICTLFRYMF